VSRRNAPVDNCPRNAFTSLLKNALAILVSSHHFDAEPIIVAGAEKHNPVTLGVFCGPPLTLSLQQRVIIGIIG